VKLPGPLARVDGLLTAMRTSPRHLHDCNGGQRPVWVHSSSVADHFPRPPSSKSAARIITAAFLIRQNARLFGSELTQDRASDAQAQDASEGDVDGLKLIRIWRVTWFTSGAGRQTSL